MNEDKKALLKEIRHNEERISALEEVALILRAKIEPETLTEEAIERADKLAMDREDPCKEEV